MRVRFALAFTALCCGCTAQADSGSLSVSAVVLSRSSCRITGQSSLTLPFGNVDPASATDATATVSTTIRCAGSDNFATYAFAAGDGQNPLGAGDRRMRHGTVVTEFLPYGLSIAPASATIPKGATQLITITGTITPAQFQNVLGGLYSDTVPITLTP
jgi:spore coat protein U-like protein